jgi:hypothetical protein
MRATQGIRLSKLVAVQRFLDENAPYLPGVHASVARRRLDELVDGLYECGVNQEAYHISRKGETRRYQALRRKLVRNHLAPLVAIAQSVLVDEPALRVIRMPRGNPRPVQLLSVARGLAQAAAPHAGVLIAAGLPDDFVARINDAADAMLASYETRDSQVGRRYTATRGIVADLRAAKTIVRVLGALVRAEADDDDQLQASWNAIAAPHRAARLGASPTLAALPSGNAIAALPAPEVKLLANPSNAQDDEAPKERGGVTRLLAPLTHLFRAS